MFKRKLLLLRLMLAGGGYRRAAYLKKIRHFHSQGEHCFFVPYNYGTEPHLISFGDNVFVASDVRFVNHDVTAMMFRHMDPQGKYTNRVGPIRIGSHVFIGVGATILYDVTIGDRVIIAAGSLVNSDLAAGGIYAGVPARRVGNFEDYAEKSRKYSLQVPWSDAEPLAVRRQVQVRWCFPGTEDETGTR